MEYDHKKTNKLVFATGYLLTIIWLIIFHFISQYLQRPDIGLITPDKMVQEQTRGWRIYVFIPFNSMIIYVFIFLIQNFVLHQYEKSRIEVEMLQLKSVNTETANHLLRQQIQPHFLFNALNILKSLIKKYPETAEAYLIRLSDFLRASISRNTSGVATLKEELKLCNDYMEMQKIRFGEALIYHIAIDSDDEYINKSLPFFSLQPLLENAIKHNELTIAHPLFISVKRLNNVITVSNNLQPKKTAEISTGIGLSSLKERYKLLSGEEINVFSGDHHFTVSLKLLDHEHYNN